MKARIGLWVVSCWLGSWLGISPLAAQYIAPGSTRSQTTIPDRQDLVDAYDGARWELGRVRIDPWLGIHDASYVTAVDDQGQDQHDFTLTAGAGLRTYLRTGSKLFWSAHALPEYVWWQDADEKSHLDGRYGLGAFGYFNRLRVELSARRTEVQDFFSSEVQQLTSNRSDILRVATEVDVGGRIALRAVFQRLDTANQDDTNASFSRLDRVDETLDLGVDYRLSDRWTVGLGFLDRDTRFADDARRLSNSGQFASLRVGLEANRLAAHLEVADESLEPADGSLFRPFDETTGNAELLWRLRRSVSLLAYGRRDLNYSIDSLFSYFLADRFGARLDLGASQSQLGLFAETGQDDYVAVAGIGAGRRDDVTSYGLEYRFNWRRWTTIGFRLVRTEYRSDDGLFDREVTRFAGLIEIGRLFEKLNLGQADRDW